MISAIIICHLIGDFLFQNHWMQRKAKSSVVCSVHVLAYSMPFWFLATFGGVGVWQVVLILVQHWLQDRFALHLRWMRLYQQTPPEIWPVGPLCVDQAWHIASIGLVVWLT
jgi:hypothetical protein